MDPAAQGSPVPAAPILSSAEQSLFPNSLPVRHTLPNIHSFSASAATSPPVPVAQQQGSPYGAQRPVAAQQRGYSGAGSPYGNLPAASPHTTPTPPIIPPANSPPIPASAASATAPTAAAASPTTAPSAPPAQPQPQPAAASPQPTAASPQLGQQQPAAGQAGAGGARGNPMSVSSMLSGPPRHPPVSAYSSIPSSLPSSSASPVAPVTAPQPPVLPPPASTAAVQDKPAGSAASPPLNPPTLPGFVQGGFKPPTGTAAPPPAATPAATEKKDEQHPPTSRSGSAYPPLPSAFARENPYSPAAAPASASVGSGTASPAQQQQQAKASPSPAAPLAPGAPQAAQAAATIKNSFFPSLGSYRPGAGQAGGAKPAPQQSTQQQQQQQQQTFAAPQYPWQQAHLAGGYGGLAGKDKLAQPGQQQQRPTPAAASPAGARPANGLGGGGGHPPSPGKGQQPPAIQQQKPAQARFSSLFADGPFGGRNGAPASAASPASASTAATAGGAGANGAGVKRRRSDAAEQGQAGAAAAAGHHHHHHHHAHGQHQHQHQHVHQHQQHSSHTHVSHAQIPMPQLGSHAAPAAQAQQQQAQAGLPPLPGSAARPPALAAGAVPKSATTATPPTATPPPAAPSTPPLPPPPPFTYEDLRKATIHPPLVEVLNAAVEAAMPAGEGEGERPFLGRVVYDPLVEPARLLDGEVLKAGVGGTVEVFVPTSWLLGPPPAPSASPSLSSAPAAETDLAGVRLSCSRPPSNPHPVALSFGPPSLYSGAPLPLCPSDSLLSLPAHLTDLPSLRKRKVWGTDVYTDDSDVLAVLLHSGWLRVGRRERRKRAGERGAGEEALKRALMPGEPPRPQGEEEEEEESVPKALKVTLGVCPPLVRYQGLGRQGVRSRSWGNGHDGVSLRVEKVEGVESLPPPPAHRSRKPSSLAFARQLAQQRQAHFDLHGHAHHDAGPASEGDAFEPEAKRYRFAVAAGGEREGEKMQQDGLEREGEGGGEMVEVTDTFVLDIRSGVGRFVYPEADEDEEEGEEYEGEEGGGMEVDVVGV
ncbi:hypothetical protein JCM8097_008821 [Rhodosporidiobolus ruineniae]